MPTQLTISEVNALQDGNAFTCLALVKKNNQTYSGGEMIRLECHDRDARFTTALFSSHPLYEQIKKREFPGVVSIKGTMKHYRGAVSPEIVAIDDVPGGEVEAMIDRFVQKSKFAPEQMKAQIDALIDSLQPESLKLTVRTYIDAVGPAFYRSPAAKSVHQAYLYGLVEHTLWMAKCAEKLIPLYQHIPINRHVVIAGIICHDAYKALEYTQGLITAISVRGLLLGHIADGYANWVAAAKATSLDAQLTLAIGHIILSHHGEQEFGSPVKPATAEAVLVNSIDMLDAKLGSVFLVLRNCPNREVTEFALGIGNKLVAQINDAPETTPVP